MRKRDPLRLTALAAFKVAMVNGKVPPRVGGTPKRYAAASADVYVSSMTQIHSIREPAALFKRVKVTFLHESQRGCCGQNYGSLRS